MGETEHTYVYTSKYPVRSCCCGKTWEGFPKEVGSHRVCRRRGTNMAERRSSGQSREGPSGHLLSSSRGASPVAGLMREYVTGTAFQWAS